MSLGHSFSCASSGVTLYDAEVEKFWKVPVEVDATASGLQLLSAMRRDPVGMKYVNLLPPESEDDDPQDAYMQVLLSVAEQMAARVPHSLIYSHT